MFNQFRFASTAFFVAALALPGSVQATVFCATTTAQLLFALDQADSNGQDDVIRIAQGIINVPQGNWFEYRGGSTFNGDNNDLTIIGGWVPALGDPCGRLPEDARTFDTVLNGEGRERILRIYAGENSDITISGIAFLNGNPSEGGSTRGGGLSLTTFGDTAGTLTVERSAFVANRAVFSPAVRIGGARTVRFINNLVTGNTSGNTATAVEITQNDENGVYVINNTIINNDTDGPFGNPATTGIRIFVSGSAQALVANNIIWGNEYKDIDYAGTGFIASRNNNIEASNGTADLNENNQSIEPTYDGEGFLNFTLAFDSPLANAGLRPPPPIVPFPSPFDMLWSIPDTDLYGQARITNGRVDIGAFETAQDGIFGDRFED